jgi:hypothetical protein
VFTLKDQPINDAYARGREYGPDAAVQLRPVSPLAGGFPGLETEQSEQGVGCPVSLSGLRSAKGLKRDKRDRG